MQTEILKWFEEYRGKTEIEFEMLLEDDLEINLIDHVHDDKKYNIEFDEETFKPVSLYHEYEDEDEKSDFSTFMYDTLGFIKENAGCSFFDVLTHQHEYLENIKPEPIVIDDEEMSIEDEIQLPPSSCEKIQNEINEWKANNSFIQMEVKPLINGEFSAEFSFEIGTAIIPFTMFFSEEWHPVMLISEVPEIEELLATLNSILSSEPQGISQILMNISLHLHEAFANQKDNIVAEPIYREAPEPQIEIAKPTEQEFEDILIPEIRKALRNDHLHHFEIEEWIRKVREKLNQGQMDDALHMVAADVFNGILPNSIRQYFPIHLISNRYSYHYASQAPSKFDTVGITDSCKSLLMIESNTSESLDTKSIYQYKANCISNDLLFWNLKLIRFPPETKLEKDLKAYAKSCFPKPPEPEITVEIKYAWDHPVTPPILRITSPTFVKIKTEEELLKQKENKEENVTTVKDINDLVPLEDITDEWDYERGLSLAEISNLLKTRLQSKCYKIDLTPSAKAFELPTIGNFWKTFYCQSPTEANKPYLETGGKIILPVSVLKGLENYEFPEEQKYGYNRRVYADESKHQDSSPMVFELSNGSIKRSYAGVLEFSGQEGHVVMPTWMIQNLALSLGSEVSLRRVKPPKGKFVRLQPHSSEFLDISDHKAVLEQILPNWTAFAPSDTIVIEYLDTKYALDICEVSPGRVISCTDVDLTTDFAPPLDGKYSSMSSEANTNEKKMEVDQNIKEEEKEEKEEKEETKEDMKIGGEETGKLNVTEGQVEGVDYKICENCRHSIPMTTYPLHSMTCFRINYFCEICQICIKKSEKEQHDLQVHS